MKGHCCDTTFWMCVYAEEKRNDWRSQFLWGITAGIYHLPMDHIKTMREFNAIVGREDLYKPTFENDSWHVNSSANGVRVVNFATSKNLVVKSKILQY